MDDDSVLKLIDKEIKDKLGIDLTEIKDSDEKLITLTALMFTDKNPPNPKEFDKQLTKAVVELLKLKAMTVRLLNAEKKEEENEKKYPTVKEVQHVEFAYNPNKHSVTINAAEEDFDKDFLKYLLEMQNIPTDVEIKFKKPSNLN